MSNLKNLIVNRWLSIFRYGFPPAIYIRGPGFKTPLPIYAKHRYCNFISAKEAKKQPASTEISPFCRIFPAIPVSSRAGLLKEIQ
jgi:hypothetical protein